MKELITEEIKKRAEELRKEEAYRLGVMETKKKYGINGGEHRIQKAD